VWKASRAFRTKRLDLAVLGLYGLLTLMLASSLVSSLNTVLAGQSSDVYHNPWADWWTKKALTEGLDFYYTDYMFYPQGTSLAFHSFTHVNTFIILLLTPLTGYFAAYNMVILLAYTLSGFGMYLLVTDLTGSRPAAFVAGLVFAFYPYHVFESAHPVLVTTQWMPLFALALMRSLRRTGPSQVKQVLLAALWFLLTALSSWHLMIMLSMWTSLYLLYEIAFERSEWAPRAFRALTLLAAVVGLVLVPFLWPMMHELVTSDAGYVTKSSGHGCDLLSFIVPNQYNPLLGSLADTLGIEAEGGFTRKHSAYLGYVAIGLAVVGVVNAGRKTRFWLLAGFIFYVLSLGSQVHLNEVPLHSFSLPWAVPIIGVLRHPRRLHVLVFFCFAVLVGYGGHWLHNRIALRSRILAHIALASVAGFVLLEYLILPFPTTPTNRSPFWDRLAQEEGDFAVADFPKDNLSEKYAMFCQIFHGKKIVSGRVSRTPREAEAFWEANPLLERLSEGIAPDPGWDMEQEFARLAAQDIRYIVVHKHLLKSEEVENWRGWLGSSHLFYEDERLIVYCTDPTH
jgi:hypothetical protein